MARSPHLLMCPPDFFGIEYEINPWMSRQRQADHPTAVEQWRQLHDLVRSLGAQVSLLEPVPGLPDFVFTANAALIHHQQAIVSYFRYPQRQGEQPFFLQWFRAHGFSADTVPGGGFFEGAGDALFCGDTLFAGYRTRSDAGTHQRIAKSIDCRVVPVEMVDPYYYHLDTCFCPIAPDRVIWYPPAFDDYGQRAIAELIPHRIEVVEHEARSFACNAVVLGDQVITNEGCTQLHASLKEAGFQPHATPLHEFVKAGGSAKCLTLRLDGEDAARWSDA